MARPSHPDAMAPARPAPTRVAPPEMPASWWSTPRMRSYLLFDATGFLYLLTAFVAIRIVWQLGAGPSAWAKLQASLTHPLYIAFHAIALAAVVFVGVRFFALFPKAQPHQIGPAKPPPAPILKAMLYAAWVLVTALLSVVLAGGIF